MERPFRWAVNVQTGERRRIELTDAEIAHGDAVKSVENAEVALRNADRAQQAARQAKLDALLDKLEADPTILDRIR